MKTIMSDLDRWHGDEKLYEQEAIGEKTEDGKTTKTALPGMLLRTKIGQMKSMTWNQFRDFYFRSHNNICKVGGRGHGQAKNRLLTRVGTPSTSCTSRMLSSSVNNCCPLSR